MPLSVAYFCRAGEMILKTAEKMKRLVGVDGVPTHDAWNRCSVEMVLMTKVIDLPG